MLAFAGPDSREQTTLIECQEHVARALELATQLMELARRSHDGCQHDGCRLLNGVVGDAGMKIHGLAQWWARELTASQASLHQKDPGA